MNSLLTIIHRFIDYLPPDIALFVQTMQVDIPKLVTKTINNLNAGIVYPRPVLVGALIGSSLSEEEKAPERISAETLSILGAGTETTAWSVLVFSLLGNFSHVFGNEINLCPPNLLLKFL